MLSSLARVYLAKEEWDKYESVVRRIEAANKDSNSASDLNSLLWYCALQKGSSIDRRDFHTKLESLVSQPKNRKAAYLNTLALSHYRQGEYREAIRSAKEAIRLLKDASSPSDEMIIALSLAKLDEQRIGWLPDVVRFWIRNRGLSEQWSEAIKQKNAVDAWMLEKENALSENQALSAESLILLKIELPHLLKEWNWTPRDKVPSSIGLKNL